MLLTAAGIIPLLPGLAVYQGLLALSRGEPKEGIPSLVEAATIAIALAAGVLLGQLLAGRLLHEPNHPGG
ncbi:MAG: threonine/serine exporter family protein [Actinomycetes bacterium]